MKKVYFFLCLFLMSLIDSTAEAKTVSPYSFDFDETLETADHSFAPAGWGHIVDNYTAYGTTEWVDYKWNATSGIDDSGALFIGKQMLEIDDDDDETHYKSCKDLLVTPAITGTSSIWVKKGRSGSGSIDFYIVTEEDGKLKAGSRISVTVPTLNASNYVQVNIPQQADGSRIGICGSNVYVDNFSAASAEIEMKTEIRISSVKSAMPKNYDADENGKFNVAFKVNVRNTGNVDIAKDTENFSISLINATLNDSVMATVNIPQDLAAGELSDSIDISAQMDVKTFPGEYLYKVRENLGGSSIDALKFQIIPHTPSIGLYTADGKKEYADDATLYYGMNKKAATGTFILKNDGGASLDISAITAPEGYVINKIDAFSIAPHDTAKVIITMTADAIGKKDGELIIKSNAGDKKYSVKGEIVDPAIFFVDFENGMPGNMYNIGGWSIDSAPKDIGMIGNENAAYAYYSSGDAKRIVTPLLEVKEDEVLRFIAARKDKTTASLDILYSADRMNWTLAHTVSTSAENDADKLSDEVMDESSWSPKFAFKEYTVDNIPAGKYYIAFDNKNAYADNIYGFHEVAVEHDVIIASASIKPTGTVNTEMTAHAKLLSLRKDAEEADSYTLGLYVDDKLAASAPAVKMAQNKDTEFTFSYTPHAAGTHNVTVKFISGDYIVESAPMTIDIAAETSESVKAAGNKSSNSYQDGPLYTYENESETELIYKPEDIDIPVGSKITQIAFRGYISWGNLDANVRVYMESTDMKKFDTNTIDADSTKMTKIFDGVVHFEEGGTATGSVNELELTFKEPIVYDGKGIHLLLTHNAKSYKSIYFDIDESITDQAKHAYKSYLGDKTEYCKLPVAYFSIAIDPHTISGKVTDKATGAAIKDAVVYLTNKNVEYSATTDADGKYNMPIFKFDRKYSVGAKKLGYYLEPMDETDVNETENTLNIAMTEAKNLIVANAVTPTEAMVNHAYTMSVDVFNYMATDKKADDYTVKLKVNGEVTSSAKSVDIAAGEKATLILGYTPHEAGTDKLVAELTDANKNFTTSEVEVAVDEEKASTEKQVCDALSNAKDAPINTYWKHGETQTIYTAKMLKLKKGMKITRITYKGWTPGNVEAKAKIWLENTTDDNSSEMAMGDTTKMQLVFDDVISHPNGTQVGSPTEPADILVIDIPDGFVYEGNNLRIAGRGDVLNGSSAALNYVADNNESNTTYVRISDSDLNDKKWDKAYNTSVLYLTVEYKYNVSGSVNDNKENTPVSGATVMMESDDVIYATTTDADGKYSMDVLQPSLSYTMTVSADEYIDFTKENIKSDDDLTINVPLEHKPTTGINGVAFGSDSEVSVYTVDGTFIGKGRDIIGKLANGSYIIKDNATNKTKKLIKKD